MGHFFGAFLAFLALASIIPGFFAMDFGFPYGEEKVRGVNLGGWLVIEVWSSSSSWVSCSMF